MRHAIRNVCLAAFVVFAVAVLGLVSTTTATVALAAASGATALIMGGTGHPLSTPPDVLSYVKNYLAMAVNNYIDPASTMSTGVPGGPYNSVAVVTPEEFAPDHGTLTYDQSVAEGVVDLDNCIKATNCVYNPGTGASAPNASDAFVVFGFSQSATIATFEKRGLAEEYATGEGPDVSFVVIANGNRPNGGFLARGPEGVTIPSWLTFGGATFSGPTPTDTQYSTVDIARQYDGWSDFPVNPLNLLADINAMMGINYLHTSAPGYAAVALDDPSIINQGTYGDTTYYLAPTPILPLLMPLEQLPAIGYAWADSLDPSFRVVVESAYDRSISPGVPTSWNVLYLQKPVKFLTDLTVSLFVGADNGFQDLFGIRPWGTQRPGPYGVGGPPVDSSSAATVSAPAAAEPTASTPTVARPTASTQTVARPTASSRTVARPTAASQPVAATDASTSTPVPVTRRARPAAAANSASALESASPVTHPAAGAPSTTSTPAPESTSNTGAKPTAKRDGATRSPRSAASSRGTAKAAS